MFSNNLFYLQENAISLINKVQTFKAIFLMYSSSVLSIDHECRWMCWMCTLPSGPSVVCMYMDGVRRHFRPFSCQKLRNADCL